MFSSEGEDSTMATDTLGISDPAAISIAFGPFRVFPIRWLLTEAGKPVHIGSRAFDILLALLERPGELISNAELIARVWPSTFVEQANLAVQVAGLRRALGDGRGKNRYVINVPRRGYRFVAPVSVETEVLSELTASTPATPRDEGRHAPAQKRQQRRVLTIVRPAGAGQAKPILALLEKLLVGHDEGVVDMTPFENS
jgi:DNA-binding winged helix-turn-helix (wHTH) protein